MNLPRMALVRQTFDATRVADVPAAVRGELERIGARDRVAAGQTVAVTAGSRGIDRIDQVIRSVVDFFRDRGARPFVFPAMGSHGGATAQGQADLLAHFGITESAMGCPIRSTIDVDQIATTPDGVPVMLDRCAGEADHIVVVNRVKPHTKFEGPIESGLMKMMAVGMGNPAGAEACHMAAVALGMGRVVESVGLAVLENAPVLCGLGLVENGCDRLASIEAVLPGDLVRREQRMLVEARGRMARIPFDDIDLLIVDEMGKNISGTGMDTNVTGVNRDILGGFSATPRTRRLFVRDLTEATRGNALGIGLADFTTSRLVAKIDRKKTYVNCLTAISPEKAVIPMHFDTDRECIEAAVHCLGSVPTADLRVVHIRNTRTLETICVSRAYLPEIEAMESLDVAGPWQPLAFGEDGNLVSPFPARPSGSS